MIFDLLEIDLFHSFIRFNGNLYKVIKVFSPFIADSQLEYKYMISKYNPNNLNILFQIVKDMDDFLVEVIKISKNIYPPELILEPSHGTGQDDHNLDLNVNISENN